MRFQCSNYAFAIDPGSTIEGIEVKWHVASAGLGLARTHEALIADETGMVGPENKAMNEEWPADGAVIKYGGPADLWSLSWTPAEINDADFGAVISAGVAASSEALINAVEICVTTSDGVAVLRLPAEEQ
jgi:hypothetical protein